MPEDVVRAKRFELVDDEGETRALWDTGSQEHVALSFYGKNQEERLSIGVMPDGFSTFVLRDESGREIIKATTANDFSDSVIVIKDESGQVRAQVGVNESGEPTLTMTDENENVRAQMFVDSNGEPNLILKDEAGKSNVSASVRPQATGLVIADGSDTGRIGLYVLGDSSSSISVADAMGQPRAILRTDEAGKPILVLLDEEGDTIDGMLQR